MLKMNVFSVQFKVLLSAHFFLEEEDEIFEKRKRTVLDYTYCIFGVVLNVVLLMRKKGFFDRCGASSIFVVGKCDWH